MVMKRQEVAFFGKISAAMTHDMRNVLAIIRESSGLMQDLLSLCEEGAFPYQQKFHGLLTAIQDQVNRGVELATHFNRFAHSMDHAVSEVDGNEVARQVVALMQRFARLRKVQLLVSVAERPIAFRTDSFALHRILGECVSTLLQYARDGDAITLAVGPCEGGAEFSILTPETGAPAKSGSAGVLEELREVMEYLQSRGGSLQRVTVPDAAGITMVIPSSPSLAP